MNPYIKTRLLISLIVGCMCACASGQTELISLVKQTQTDLKTCQTDLNQTQVKEQVSHERYQHLEQEVSRLQKEILLKRKQGRNNRATLAGQSRVAHGLTPNLRKLNQKQITVFVKSVGGDVKLVGNRLMAVFGKLKTQLIYNPKDHVLTAHARFKGYNGTMEFINDWNRTKRFSRAYLDRDQDVVLEAEIDIEPGMSEEAIKTWMRGFGIILNFFQHSLSKAGTAPSQPNRGLERHRI